MSALGGRNARPADNLGPLIAGFRGIIPPFAQNAKDGAANRRYPERHGCKKGFADVT